MNKFINREIELGLDDVLDFIVTASDYEIDEIRNAVDVDTDVEVNLSDVLNYIHNAYSYEINEIRRAIGGGSDEDYSEFITFDNLRDREKVLILKELFDKLSLEELQKLQWK